MRRLLSEADERATSKSRVLQDRLEEAEKERDKFEHEMLSSSRRTNRQLEELKQRVRDLERESKTLAEDKEALEGKEREWRRRREELEVSYLLVWRALPGTVLGLASRLEFDSEFMQLMEFFIY